MFNNLVISYDEWHYYIRVNKIKILKKIDLSSLLDNSKEHKIFTNLLQYLFDIDIFDISRISYLAFSFIELHINSYLHDIFNITTQDNTEPHINNNTPIHNQIHNQIHNILYFIINLIIHIELTLNLHLFMLVYLLKKNEKYVLESNNNRNINNFIKPKILIKFEKIYNEIELQIKSSSFLLLLLKINYKILNIFDYLDNDIILKEKNFIIKNKQITNKINNLLDSFILAIENIYKTDNTDNTDNTVIENYSVCINYILDLSNLLYSYFDLGFEILIKYLKIENPDKKESFDIIHKTIFTFLKNELNILENKLL